MGRPQKSELPQKFSELLQRIGANIRTLREERGMSQAELARRAKISNTTLNEMEKRRSRDIRLSTLSAIAHVLEVSVVFLFQGTDVDLAPKDQARLLKASDTIAKITRKLR